MNWQDLPEFQFVDLTDSCVLSWEQSGGDLVFDVEASLWPGHLHYQAPRPNEWTCYKRARLIFPRAVRVDGLLSMNEATSSTDPDGTVDYDCIDFLEQNDSGYRLVGEFGEVTIKSDQLRFEVVA